MILGMDFLKDILDKRRLSSDIKWAIKKFTPSKTQIHRKSCSPLSYQFNALNSSSIQNYVKELSKKCGISTMNLYILVEQILREIGYNRDINTVRSTGLVVLKIMKRILNKLYLAESNLLKIRFEMGNNPVIFLPTHRSYADFILMAYLCYEYNIEIPAVVAGMDFHSMLVVSNLLRNCGALFMRRSFSNDKTYATVFKTYVNTILKRSPAPFEFFIEGTRSRCGKSLMPKLGLLKMVVESYKDDELPDITLVPISISYDRIMEDALMAYEVLGQPKPKESTKGLFKGIRTMDKQYGNIYINLNESISVKEYFQSGKNSLLDLALTVVERQQDNSVITCFNILAMIITCRLNSGIDSPISLSNAVSEITQLKHLLKIFKAIIGFKDGEEETEIVRMATIHEKILLSDSNNYISVKLNDNLSTMEDPISDRVPLMMLQYYANPCLHFLVNPSIIAVIIMAHRSCNIDQLYSFYQLLRLVLSEEFVFHKVTERMEFEEALEKLEDENIVSMNRSNTPMTFEYDSKIGEFFHHLLHPFILGYVTIAEFFHKNFNISFEEKMLVKKLRSYIEQKFEFSQFDVVYIYSLSSCFILNTIRSLSNAEIIICKRDDMCIYVCDNEASLSSIISFLSKLIPRCNEMPGNVKQYSLSCKL